MANQWLRLWHDMPNDPKWRTIARISGEPLSLVIAVYMHLLVDASQNVTRGHVDVTAEDLSSALDVTEPQIAAIFKAMEGRVIVNSQLSGWDKRQVKREEPGADPDTRAKSAAQRKADQRTREAAAKAENVTNVTDVTQKRDMSRNSVTCHETTVTRPPISEANSPDLPQKSETQVLDLIGDVTDVTGSHDASRNVTLDKDKKRVDKEKKNTNTEAQAPFVLPNWIPADAWAAFMETRKHKKAKNTDYALSLLVKTLEKIGADGLDPIEALNASIKAGWPDVYPPKGAPKTFSKPSGKHAGFSELNYHEGIGPDGSFA